MNNQLDRCPICGERGVSVPYKTVTRIVNQDARKLVAEDNYFLCMDSRCDVGYFNSEKETIDKSMFKRPIWFKRGAEQRIGNEEWRNSGSNSDGNT
ncbi:MAG: hypothetical protein P1Q69_15960 [Candidatus Thorarchaeota archaeon]|nr:hypothetical protein [Candidatus Thorarchaeota archaeon]